MKAKEILASIIKRLNNKGSIIALASLVVSLIIQFGVDVDSNKVMGIVQTICNILIVLGILNEPIEDTKMYIPGVQDKLVEKDK